MNSNTGKMKALALSLQDAAEALRAEDSTQDAVEKQLGLTQDMMCSIAEDIDNFPTPTLVLDVMRDLFESIELSKKVTGKLFSAKQSSSSQQVAAQGAVQAAAAAQDGAATAAAGHADGSDVANIASLKRPVTAGMGLSSVAGLAHAKETLMEAVVLPMRYPHLFTGARKPWRSVLLFGPPGTGKTRLAHAVAAEVDAELYCVSPADLLSSWFGKTEQNIRDLFGQLRLRAQSHTVIVFLDEVDGLCRRRSNEEPESTRRMKTELLNQLQEADNTPAAATAPAAAPSSGGMTKVPRYTPQFPKGQLFFLCATNCPWEIDPAFLRRFQRRIFIALPDRMCRLEMIRMLASGLAGPSSTDLDLNGSDWERILDRTEGFSGSDLADLVKNALYQPIRELSEASYWKPIAGAMWMPCSSNTIGAVRQSLRNFPPSAICARNATVTDFYTAVSTARPTVCQADLRRYDQFTEQFGLLG